MIRQIYAESYVKFFLIAMGAATAATGLDMVNIDINLGLNVLVMMVLLVVIYRRNAIDCLFDAIFGSILLSNFEMLLFFMLSLKYEALLESFMALNVTIISIVVFFFTLLQIKTLRKKLQTLYEKYQPGIRWICGNLILIQMIYMKNWNINDKQFGEQKNFLLSLMIIIIVTNIFLMVKITETVRQKEELRRQQELGVLEEKFLKEMATKQHEFSRHLSLINGLAKGENSQQSVRRIEEYIGELIEVRNIEGKSTYVGDGVMSAFLHEKEQEAREKDIQFSVMVKKPFPQFPCKKYELIELAGNLISNAFEAVETLEEGHRNVYFKITETKGQACLKTLNTIAVDFMPSFQQMVEKGYSSKQGKLRGYGLHNVKTIVERYNGQMEISLNEEVLKVEILF